MYFGLKFVPVTSALCGELARDLGAASVSCNDLREHLVPSLALQMRNQGQES